ncbi:MAG: hypothetical protein F8N39_18155 [Clostridiaceae bacterium]|nr:hypothetical protein [Clostridiaceae bacterium]
MNWEVLYSVLKMTREGRDNELLEDKWYIEQIKKEITIRDIEKMKSVEVKEAVINFLKAIVPDLR